MESETDLYRAYLAVTKITAIDEKIHFTWKDVSEEFNRSGLLDMTEIEVEGYRDILLLLLSPDEKSVFLSGEHKLKRSQN